MGGCICPLLIDWQQAAHSRGATASKRLWFKIFIFGVGRVHTRVFWKNQIWQGFKIWWTLPLRQHLLFAGNKGSNLLHNYTKRLCNNINFNSNNAKRDRVANFFYFVFLNHKYRPVTAVCLRSIDPFYIVTYFIISSLVGQTVYLQLLGLS